VDQRKIHAASSLLGRPFHADAFVVGNSPQFWMLFFGGSGVSADAYRARRETLVPVFDDALASLARSFSFGFVFVTAPFDVPFLRFPDEPEAADRWCAHVRQELVPSVTAAFPSLRGVPRYVSGYSGGAALALAGHHLDSGVFGAGFLGADQVDRDLTIGPSWAEPVSLYYNQDDDVFHANVAAIRALEADARAVCYRRLPGAHALADYLVNESFGGLVRRAGRTAPAI